MSLLHPRFLLLRPSQKTQLLSKNVDSFCTNHSHKSTINFTVSTYFSVNPAPIPSSWIVLSCSSFKRDHCSPGFCNLCCSLNCCVLLTVTKQENGLSCFIWISHCFLSPYSVPSSVHFSAVLVTWIYLFGPIVGPFI